MTENIQSSDCLIGIVLTSLSLLSAGLTAQDASRLIARDLPNQNTVSTNQLLTPRKALQATQRARIHLIAGRVDQAQREIARVLDISPRCAVALDIQGAIHFQTGDVEGAAKDFHEAVDTDPTLGSAQLGLAMSLIARDRLEDALEPLDRAASLLPNSWLVHFEEAVTRLGLGDADAALRQINYAERFTAGNPEQRSATVYVRGMAYVRLRDHDNAKKYLEDAVALDPNGFYAVGALKRLEQLNLLLK